LLFEILYCGAKKYKQHHRKEFSGGGGGGVNNTSNASLEDPMEVNDYW
jgi:hypothetical protein